MRKIQPHLLIGIGHRAQRTLQSYLNRLPARLPCILTIAVNYANQDTLSNPDGIHPITLPRPTFQANEWPAWLPGELGTLPEAQRARTRAWMRAALLQQADDIQEFLVESIPHLSSLETVEQLNAQNMSLAGNSGIDVYIIADLNEHLGSGIFIDMAYLTHHVCRQLGLTPQIAGVLYLPSATSPAPAEEAIAYAALKELEHYAQQDHYNAEFMSAELDLPPQNIFNNGCYLLDTVNELGYMLQDDTQQILAASEWLHAMTFIEIATSLREKRNRRYRNAKLGGKSRIYSSLGVAARYIPLPTLTDWTTARLGADILSRLIDTQTSIDIERHVNAFVEKLGLSADVLGERLHYSSRADIEETLKPLRHTRLRHIEARTRAALQTAREKHLTALQRQLDQNVPHARDEIHEAVYTAVQIILEDTPLGGIASAQAFLSALHDKIAAQKQIIDQKRQQQKTQLKRSLGTVSNAYYALRSATMSVPPWPIFILSIISILVLPLLYSAQLIWKTIRPLSETGASLSWGLLGGGILIVLALNGHRWQSQRRSIRDKHIELVRERFGIESASPINRALGRIYDAAHQTIAQLDQEIDALTADIHTVLTHLQAEQARHAATLEKLAQPGLCRSAVDLDSADAFYRRAVLDRATTRRQRIRPALEQLTTDFIQQAGPLQTWRAKCAQSRDPIAVWLMTRLLAVGKNLAEQCLQETSITDFVGPSADADSSFQRMLDSAKPLWNYDPKRLRRAKTQKLSLIAGNLTPTQREQNQTYSNSQVIDIQAPRHLLIINEHHGMPLLALRRLDEYRAHYAAMLRHSQVPIHITRDLVLSDDLLTVYPKNQPAPATLFAVGLALGIITRDPDGRYIAPRTPTSSRRLSADKARAAALLGMDAAACRELQTRLHTLIAAKGRGPIHAILDEYTTVVPNLEDWQVHAIVKWVQSRSVPKNPPAHPPTAENAESAKK